jgi:hypothetical protein
MAVLAVQKKEMESGMFEGIENLKPVSCQVYNERLFINIL